MLAADWLTSMRKTTSKTRLIFGTVTFGEEVGDSAGAAAAPAASAASIRKRIRSRIKITADWNLENK